MRPDVQKLIPRFWVSLLFSMPNLSSRLDPWLGLLFCTLVITLGAFPLLQKGWKNKRGPEALISLSIALLYFYSILELLFSAKPTFYFADAAFITAISLLGWILEAHLQKIGDRSKALILGLAPKSARKLFRDGHVEETSIEKLGAGDGIRIESGDIIAADGIVISGAGLVDESLVTGSAKPVQKAFGQSVFGGTKCVKEAFVVSIDKKPEESLIAKIIKSIQSVEPHIEEIQVPVAVSALALFAWLVWSLFSGLAMGVHVAGAMLIAVNPRAISLGAPLVVRQAQYTGAMQGIVIQKPEILQDISKLSAKDIGSDIDKKSYAVIVLGGDPLRFWPFAKSANAILRHTVFFAWSYNIGILILAFCGLISPVTGACAHIFASLVIGVSPSRLHAH